ncbi:MAG TPA: peroxiredoxin [Candidatus Didemnitutus sp.]|nr:peroxiredoxin [Candidatus Didemnitutus sp.]
MKLPRILVMFSALLAFFGRASADPLKVGDAAPAVTATTETGATLNFGDVYKKGYTLVYFYPKADTSGCTAQGCSLRDDYGELTKHGVTVIGVSHDTVAAQKAFKDKYSFPFSLIADPDESTSKAFGVPDITGTKLTQRQAYLIDKNGKVVWCDYKAKTTQQAEDVMKALTAIGG